jgi:hypothetical protein
LDILRLYIAARLLGSAQYFDNPQKALELMLANVRVLHNAESKTPHAYIRYNGAESGKVSLEEFLQGIEIEQAQKAH